MLKGCEKTYRVIAPGSDGGAGEIIGYYPLVLSSRTSEEIDFGDMRFTNHRLAAFAERFRSPIGGYRRGMIIEGNEGERYHVLLATLSGRLWILKLERVVYHGE